MHSLVGVIAGEVESDSLFCFNSLINAKPDFIGQNRSMKQSLQELTKRVNGCQPTPVCHVIYTYMLNHNYARYNSATSCYLVWCSHRFWSDQQSNCLFWCLLKDKCSGNAIIDSLFLSCQSPHGILHLYPTYYSIQNDFIIICFDYCLVSL